MSDSDPRITALISQVASLEAALRTGGSSTSIPNNGYPFLTQLSGENLIAAQALIQENSTLQKRIQTLEEVLEERDYRINHLKLNLERLLPQPQ
jgi:hypothetical protein